MPRIHSTPSGRLLRVATIVLASGMAGSCADGPSPVEMLPEPTTVQISLAGDFSAPFATGEAAPVTRVRLVAATVGTVEIVGSWEGPVDPNEPSWTMEFEVTLPAGATPQVIISVELMNAALGVEWSGVAGPITLSPGQQSTVASVEVGRGPLDNISVTSVSIQNAPSTLRVGKTAQLSATAATSQSGANPQIFWSDLDPDIATVSASGSVQALAVGSARFVATAGTATDRVTIQVLPAIDQVVIDPTIGSLDALGEEIQFTATVLDAAGTAIQGEGITWTVDAPGVLENRGGGTFASVGEGTATVTATVASEPGISASAQVQVKQVAVTVLVTPETETLEAVGATAQFAAAGYDANNNLVTGAVFDWQSSPTSVATIDQSGLATAKGGGSAVISATEVGSGVVGTATLVVELPLTLSISPATALLEAIGATALLTPIAVDGSGEPIGGLSYDWTSSDATVATVDSNGRVTAVKDGTANITATTSGVSATSVITVKQKVVGLQWVQQPTDGQLYLTITPAPSVEAVDANGYRVESFEGTVSLGAQWLGFEPAPPQGGSPSLDPPMKTVQGTTAVIAVLGLAVFNDIHMVDSDGFYRLSATVVYQALVLTVWSLSFYMLYY